MMLVFTAPLGNYLDKGFPYTSYPEVGNEVIPLHQSDCVQQYYHFWMAWDYLNGGPGPFFRDPYEFLMDEETNPLFTTRRLLISIVYLFLAPFGTVFAFNALLLLTLALGGFFAFLLAKHYTGKYLPSIVAGAVFGFSPFAIAQSMGGHTNGYLLFLIPFALWAIEKGIQTNKSVYYLLTTLSLSCFAFIEYHLLYYMALLLPPFYFWRFACVRPGWKPFFKSVICLSIAVGIAGSVMMFVKSYEIDISIRSTERTFAEIMLYTPWITHFFTHDYDELEKVVYLGYAVFGGALVSFLIWGWKRSLFWLYLGVFLCFGLLCLGPRCNAIPLYRWFHDYLPYFDLSRLPARMMVLVSMGAGLLIAMGLSRIKKVGWLVSILFLAVVIWDYFPRTVVGITLLPEKSKVYQYIEEDLEEKKSDKKVLCLPIWPGDSSWASHYLYQITQHRVFMVNGYYPAVTEHYVEKAFYPLYSVNVGELTSQQYELIKKFNVGYLVVHEEAFPKKVSNFPSQVTIEFLNNSPYLQYVMQDDKQTLFKVLDTPRKVRPKKVSSFIGNYLMKRQFNQTETLMVDDGFQILPPGNYVSEVTLTGDGAETTVIQLVGRDPLKRENEQYVGLEVLATSAGKEGKVKIPFTLTKGMLVQFHITKPKQGECEAEQITLRFADSKLPYKLEAEELFVNGLIVEDDNASSEQAVYVKPMTLAQQEMIFGPYREYPAGNYTVEYWVKVPSVGKEKVAVLDVVTDYGRRKIAQHLLHSSDFKEANQYQPIKLSFSLKEPEVLEFRVKYLRKIPLYVDKIEIKRND